MPEIQIFGGGAHAGRRVDIQDFMVVCPSAATFAQALDWTAEVYRVAGALMAEAGRLRGVADEGGYWPDFATNEEALETLLRAIERAGFRPGEQVAIALDVAASELGQGGIYQLGLEGRELRSEAMIELLLGWLERYPIVSIEDPLAEDDQAGFAAFTRVAGARCQVVADDLTVTDAARVRAAAEAKAANTLLIKPNQRGTLSETLAAWEAARAAGWGGIVSARSGETEDTTIVHLAIGWGVPQLKVGAFARSERMAKWNEALRIEEALGPNAKARPTVRILTPALYPGPPTDRAPGALRRTRWSRLPLSWSSVTERRDQGEGRSRRRLSATSAMSIRKRTRGQEAAMAKAIHMMVRVLDEQRAIDFYDRAFGMKIADRFDFDDFTLVYLRNPENDFEIELTVNKGRREPYQHGDGYGHVAFVVDDLDAEHRRFQELGLQPADIKEFHRNGGLMARFFFVQDPDGYKIEVLQRHGRYQ